MSWYVYLLHCADDSYYTGITTEPKRRLNEHNHDDKKAAKYTRVRRPLKMVYFELCDSRSEAGSREYEIRKSNRKKKIQLASSMLGEIPDLYLPCRCEFIRIPQQEGVEKYKRIRIDSKNLSSLSKTEFIPQ